MASYKKVHIPIGYVLELGTSNASYISRTTATHLIGTAVNVTHISIT